MKRKTEIQISLMAFLATLLIATSITAQSNGQVVITPSKTCIPPTITIQPSNLSRVCKGTMQTFFVEATGTGPLSYQWYRSGIPTVAVGSNSNNYTMCCVARADIGYYYVVVTNACGSVTSQPSILTTELLPNSSTVPRLSLAVPPVVTPVAVDAVDGTITGVLESVVDTPDPLVSNGKRAYIYSFKNRAGCTYNWIYTYTIDNSTAAVPEKSACTMIIPNGFSPNGDGINDYFLVSCIEKYPDAKLQIYSGTSTLIYEQEHYGNFDFWGNQDAALWKGNDRDKNELAPGSYIYVLDLEHGRKEMIKTGVVFISR